MEFCRRVWSRLALSASGTEHLELVATAKRYQYGDLSSNHLSTEAATSRQPQEAAAALRDAHCMAVQKWAA